MKLYWIAQAQKAPLAIGPRPQADELLSWVNDLRHQNVDHVVSFITDEEVDRYELADEANCLRRHDIGFTHFPIDDFDVPFAGSFDTLVRKLDALRSRGETLLLHCAGGVGRSGTTACCLLVCEGSSSEDAMEMLSNARGCCVPESDDQFDFVRSFKPPSPR